MKMKKIGLLFMVFMVVVSCKDATDQEPQEGMWLGSLTVQDNEQLPFNFVLGKDSNGGITVELINGEERILLENVLLDNDSILIKSPVFEGYISGRYTSSSIEGEFIKESLDRFVSFKAEHGDQNRFKVKKRPTMNISGIWETEFSPNTEDSYFGKGIFTQKGDKVTGTFRTTTGDYRYLEGVMDGDSLKLSVFDGAHAFLFTAKATDSSLNGIFYSGNHFQEPFVARRNESYELPDPDSLTFIKPGFEKFGFSFPNDKGTLVSLEDDRYKNKVVVVQIMGTWCPNCLDESKFLVNYLKNNDHANLEVVALAFEYAKTEEGAFKGINRLKSAIGIEYPILLAQYGTSNKSKAQEKLPMLNHVLSYPTTLIIDKKGAVRKIHTGFNGPATGAKYEVFKKKFDEFVKKLANE